MKIFLLAHLILKKARCKCFMELGGCLQQELEPEQLWFDIAGESYGSSFEFEGFVLNMDKQESTPRAGSSRGRQPAEKELDQCPARSDCGARSKSVKCDQRPARGDSTRSNASKSDRGKKLKKKGKNLSYVHKDTSPSRSRRASSVSRSGKNLSQNTHDDVQLCRPRSSPSPGSRDLGPAWRVYTSSGSGSEMADGHSSSPVTARRASKRLYLFTGSWIDRSQFLAGRMQHVPPSGLPSWP